MEHHEQTDEPVLRMRSGRLGRIVAAGALAAGLAVGGYAVAGAATGSTTTRPAVSSQSGRAPSIAGNDARPPRDGQPPACDPGSMPHGPGETELTGDTADKVKAAALTAVPGGTIVRVETDSSGETPYEAHVKKADGSFVVVQVKSDFSVAATHDGFGAPPKGAPQGPPPQGAHQGPPPAGNAGAGHGDGDGDGHGHGHGRPDGGPCMVPPPAN
jgi:hypothetical protein